MSADNWTTCRNCIEAKEAEIAALESKIENAYGKVSVQVFDKTRADLEELRSAHPGQTFREDYEFYGAEDGVTTWDYTGCCEVCGYGASATGNIELKPKKK